MMPVLAVVFPVADAAFFNSMVVYMARFKGKPRFRGPLVIKCELPVRLVFLTEYNYRCFLNNNSFSSRTCCPVFFSPVSDLRAFNGLFHEKGADGCEV